MFKTITVAALAALLSLSQAAMADANHPKVLLHTSAGDITLELDAVKAPLSVENFLAYVNSGHYDGTIFHRVINNFMIQGGGFDQNMVQKATQAPIKNEAKNGLKNTRGSIAMARTSVVDSATSQFFINHKDNAFLDHGSRDYGYAVFGQVIDGMPVVDAIAKARTMPGDRPVDNIVILKASVLPDANVSVEANAE